MLSMNFTEQIYNCYRYLPPDCQVRPGGWTWTVCGCGRGTVPCVFYWGERSGWGPAHVDLMHSRLCLSSGCALLGKGWIMCCWVLFLRQLGHTSIKPVIPTFHTV